MRDRNRIGHLAASIGFLRDAYLEKPVKLDGTGTHGVKQKEIIGFFIDHSQIA